MYTNMQFELYKNYVIDEFTPFIYSGFKSIYDETKMIEGSNSRLKTFQIFLKKIPSWTDEITEKESNRIQLGVKNYGLLTDATKCVVKLYTIILSTNPLSGLTPQIGGNSYQNIDINKLVHEIYKRCAREFWKQPGLFDDEVDPIQQQQNMLRIIEIIRKCINDSFIVLVNMETCVDNCLNTDRPFNIINNDTVGGGTANDTIGGIFRKPEEEVVKINVSQVGRGRDSSTSETEDRKKKILGMINEAGITNTSSNVTNSKTYSTSSKILDSSDPSSYLNSSSPGRVESSSESSSSQLYGGGKSSSDSDLQLSKILENKDITTTNTDSETSLYDPGRDNDNLIDVYSNVGKMDTAQKKDKIKQNKFFQNYMKM